MVSGAGHDAMILAEKVPAAMVFYEARAASATIPRNPWRLKMWRRRSSVDYICSTSWLRAPPRFQQQGCAVHNLGQTRSSQQPNHLLLTSDTFVRTPLPGMKGCTAIVHAGPAIGAKFAQYTAEFEADGELGDTAAQRFVFVIEGELGWMSEGKQHKLGVAWICLLAGRAAAPRVAAKPAALS